MELKKIMCDVEGCEKQEIQKEYNKAFEGWGHVAGMYNSETGADVAHLCPKHMGVVKVMLKGSLDGLIEEDKSDGMD